jgi:hypothetical protein
MIRWRGKKHDTEIECCNIYKINEEIKFHNYEEFHHNTAGFSHALLELCAVELFMEAV